MSACNPQLLQHRCQVKSGSAEWVHMLRVSILGCAGKNKVQHLHMLLDSLNFRCVRSQGGQGLQGHQIEPSHTLIFLCRYQNTTCAMPVCTPADSLC